MLSFVKVDTDNLNLVPGQKILKSVDYMHFLESEHLIQAAQAKAAQIINDAESVYQQEKLRGYEDGQLQAKQACAEVIVDTVAQCNRYYISSEKTLTQAVLSCVGKILQGFDDVEVTLAVVREALQLVSNQKQVILHVNPEQVARVKERVSEVLAAFPEVGYVDVVADARLKNGGCILETEVGIIDASIDVQLQVLNKQIAKQFKERDPQ
ncbi:HrpE/YscL family type III secretion apparatus protein [Shewanella sp.]|uniref:HrpE/YscL family type III secretion apparatus protein n=1 Tax=Shewanella sp. TaxID=50422 RepID=UPI001EB83D71|nr:HrpE/YscL family type III secretion apparatus protein [Shewanella sp.]NRB24704.1 HrpE/YscL family type III secretion apparatus protein [Shewanella sp.]